MTNSSKNHSPLTCNTFGTLRGERKEYAHSQAEEPILRVVQPSQPSAIVFAVGIAHLEVGWWYFPADPRQSGLFQSIST